MDEAAPGTLPRILVVEDEVIPSLLLVRFLKNLGFREVDTETTGHGAVRLAAERRYGIVLMDIGLGDDLNGIEAARIITAAQDVRLLFMTGYADAEMETRARALSPEEYFIKPLDLARIRRVVLSQT